MTKKVRKYTFRVVISNQRICLKMGNIFCFLCCPPRHKTYLDFLTLIFMEFLAIVREG